MRPALKMPTPAKRPHFPSFWEGLSLRLPVACVTDRRPNFPSFWEGLSLRLVLDACGAGRLGVFPFLLGRAFIEAQAPSPPSLAPSQNFPSFWEGLSLRRGRYPCLHRPWEPFPFLLGRAFIEAKGKPLRQKERIDFPSFWEGLSLRLGLAHGMSVAPHHFPSFWEGLSLRPGAGTALPGRTRTDFPSFWEGLSLRPRFTRSRLAGFPRISLPFWRGFH